MTLPISTMSGSQVRMSMPAALLRLEGLAVLAGTLALYAYQEYSWLVFALLWLAPDLAIGIYALDKRLGSIAYNLVHTYSLPLLLAVISLWVGFDLGLQLALIWFSHIGLDRLIGYGLKYPDSFQETHLSRV